MKYALLLPPVFKRIGWAILVPSILLGLFIIISGYEFPFLKTMALSLFPASFSGAGTKHDWFVEVNLTYTLTGLFLIIGSLLVGFSREQHEDEYISGLRLSSLLWAVLINYLLLILAFMVVYDLNFLSIMTYNMFTVLLLFIFRFHYLLYRSRNASLHEK